MPAARQNAGASARADPGADLLAAVGAADSADDEQPLVRRVIRRGA